MTSATRGGAQASAPRSAGQNRSRMLVEIQEPLMRRIAADLWKMFKRLLPLVYGVNTVGLTVASKILFSVFPKCPASRKSTLEKYSNPLTTPISSGR
jgi:hypothetical protein